MTKVRSIVNSGDLGKLMNLLSREQKICFDIETQTDQGISNLDPRHKSSRVVCVSFTHKPGIGYVAPLTHPESPWKLEWRHVLRSLLQAAMKDKGKLIAHNIQYEARWVYWTTGLDISAGCWWDTLMSAHLLDENEPKDLKTIGEIELGVEPWGIDLKDAEGTEWPVLAEYNAKDTDYCWQIHEIHKEQLKDDESIARIWQYIGMPVTRSFIQIEQHGIGIDLDKVKEGKEESEEEMAEAEEDLIKWIPEDLFEEYGPDRPHEHGDTCDAAKCPSCGVRWTYEEMTDQESGEAWDPLPYCYLCEVEAKPFTCRRRVDKRYPISWAPTSNFFGAFMEANAEPIETTQKGAPCWDAAVLKKLKARGYEFVEPLLRHREHAKRIGFYDDWLARAVNGRIHAAYKPAHVVTGRTSSEGPNMQQVSKSLRPCFTPPEGWLSVEVDQSQIELRIAAELSYRVTKGKVTPRMMNAYLKGEDLHTLMASRVTGKRQDTITKEERFHAKAANFGFLYGMMAPKFVEQAWRDYQIEFTLQEAEELREAFFAQWPELALWHEHQRKIARKGYVRNLLGRKRRLPQIHSSNEYEVGEAERMAINAPVQSLASDLVLLGVIDCQRLLDSRNALIVGTVHDSVLLEVRRESVRDTIKLTSNALLHPNLKKRFGVELTVPLEVEYAVGRFWGDPEAKEVTIKQRKGS